MTRMHFPDKRASELFTHISPAYPTNTAEYFRYIDGPELDDDDGKFQLRLNVRAGVQTPRGYNHVDVHPQDWLRDWIWEQMQIVPDWYYMAVTLRSDDTFLFQVKYNKILGSRWLRAFGPDQLPENWLVALLGT